MDTAVTETATPRVRGRKAGTADHQESTIEVGVVRERMDHLINCHMAMDLAQTEYSEAVKSVAERAVIQASVLRKFVAARAGEKFGDKRRECEQLSLLFEEVGG